MLTSGGAWSVLDFRFALGAAGALFSSLSETFLSLAVNPVNGVGYGVAVRDAVFRLFRVNTETGATTAVSTTPMPARVTCERRPCHGLACDT
jgi:hypothetical protein